jgi:hypothetical protein
MKYYLLLPLLVLNACTNTPTRPATSSSLLTTPSGYSEFISIDSANRMISSYLASIDGATDEQLHALIIDADSLRAYLSNDSVRNVKLMFSHTLQYINSGRYGQPVAYTPGALTLVIAGYDGQGNYIFHHGKALERSMPCPTNCLSTGTASSDLLVQ